MKKCVFCGEQYQEHSNGSAGARSKYCSWECSKKASSKRNVEKRRKINLGSRLGLSGGKIGKISEYVVAVDLIKKGWDVYTAFEDTHIFDILAIKDGKQIRVEVKTGILLPSGRKIHKTKKGQVGHHDILAVVTNLSEIDYHPESF